MHTRREDYKEYLKSDHWKSLRSKAFGEWGNNCMFNPNHKGEIEMHHIEYREWYNCTVDDLVPLCQSCHEKVHKDIDLLNSLKKTLQLAGGVPLTGQKKKRKKRAKNKKVDPVKESWIQEICTVTDYGYELLIDFSKNEIKELHTKYVRNKIPLGKRGLIMEANMVTGWPISRLKNFSEKKLLAIIAKQKT